VAFKPLDQVVVIFNGGWKSPPPQDWLIQHPMAFGLFSSLEAVPLRPSMFPRSQFAARLATHCGIVELMEDLGSALASKSDVIMMGGGDPARIPEVEKIWSRIVADLARSDEALGAMLGTHDPPAGNPGFRTELASYLPARLRLGVRPRNIAVTPGGQTAFFFLLNLFGGISADGPKRRILLPLAPEYIGYADQGLEPDFFRSYPVALN